MARQHGLYPVFRADNELVDFYSKNQILGAESALRIRVIRSRGGQIKRAYLRLRAGDPRPSSGIPAAALKTTYHEPLPEVGRTLIAMKRVTSDGRFVKWQR